MNSTFSVSSLPAALRQMVKSNERTSKLRKVSVFMKGCADLEHGGSIIATLPGHAVTMGKFEEGGGQRTTSPVYVKANYAGGATIIIAGSWRDFETAADVAVAMDVAMGAA